MFLKNKKKQDFIHNSNKYKISLLIITYVSYIFLFYTNLVKKANIIPVKELV